MTRDTLTSGTVLVTVAPSDSFRTARALLGEEWHAEYRFRLERVENERFGTTIFLYTLTADPRHPDKPARWVYTGVVHPYHGSVRLTTRSAFPVTATRVRVADRTLRALFAGRAAEIEAARWAVSVEVEKELAGRF